VTATNVSFRSLCKIERSHRLPRAGSQTGRWLNGCGVHVKECTHGQLIRLFLVVGSLYIWEQTDSAYVIVWPPIAIALLRSTMMRVITIGVPNVLDERMLVPMTGTTTAITDCLCFHET
jgi:hypothetical protein